MTTKYVTRTIPIGSILDNYKGKSKNQIVMELGPPDRKNSDGSEGEVYTYEENQKFAYQYNFKSFSGSYTTVQNTRYFIDFYFNRSGLVYFYRTNYPDVEEKKAVGTKRTVNLEAMILIIALGLAALGYITLVSSYH